MNTEISPIIAKVIKLYFPKQIENIHVIPIKDGLINQSFRLEISSGIYVLQQINTTIFTTPSLLMANIESIAEILSKNDYPYEALKVVKTKKGTSYLKLENSFWRVFQYIQNTNTIHRVQSSDQAHQAAEAFALFNQSINAIPSERIHTIIPHFHDTHFRLQEFKKAIKLDKENRLHLCNNIIQKIDTYISEVESFNQLLTAPMLIHGDPKISNLLFCKTSHQVKAVIDWDTVLKSNLWMDVGDMIRSYCSTQTEDEADLQKIQFINEHFFAVCDAIQETYKNKLSYEIFRKAGLVVTIIQAIRFLTDFLKGDQYYRIDYPKHNLTRTLNQVYFAEQLQKVKN